MFHLIIRNTSLILITLLLSLTSCNNSKQVEEPGIISQDVLLTDLDALVKEKPDILFLDVRTPEEISDGKIANAIEIDYRANDFEEKIDALDKNKSYIVYCRSGNRSKKAMAKMRDKKFKECYNLVGGYTSYSEK
jgi:rhodanese-related sulfurtransferase